MTQSQSGRSGTAAVAGMWRTLTARSPGPTVGRSQQSAGPDQAQHQAPSLAPGEWLRPIESILGKGLERPRTIPRQSMKRRSPPANSLV